MTHKQFEDFILSLPGVWLDYPFGEDIAVYKFGRDNDGAGHWNTIICSGQLTDEEVFDLARLSYRLVSEA